MAPEQASDRALRCEVRFRRAKPRAAAARLPPPVHFPVCISPAGTRRELPRQPVSSFRLGVRSAAGRGRRVWNPRPDTEAAEPRSPRRSRVRAGPGIADSPGRGKPSPQPHLMHLGSGSAPGPGRPVPALAGRSEQRRPGKLSRLPPRTAGSLARRREGPAPLPHAGPSRGRESTPAARPRSSAHSNLTSRSQPREQVRLRLPASAPRPWPGPSTRD